MDEQQYDLIAEKIFGYPIHRVAVKAVVFKGMSCYRAEIVYDLPRSSLSRSVRRYRKEAAYIQSIMEAGGLINKQ